jgi:prepilin signal peptidase PulO-like enzyme (type II secretory pathway)
MVAMRRETKRTEEIMKTLLGTGLAILMLASPALAVDTTTTYSSGILVGVFLAFCALVVVVQLLPTIMLLVGFIKGLVKGTNKQVQRQSSKG